MLSALIAVLLAVEEPSLPTPPIPPKHPDPPEVTTRASTADAGLVPDLRPNLKEAARAAAAELKREGDTKGRAGATQDTDGGVVAAKQEDGRRAPREKDDRKKDDRSADEPLAPAPPSLTGNALCDELRKAAANRRDARSRLEDERKALATERARLEATAAEIEKAREALRAETARLEELTAQASAGNPRPKALTGPTDDANVAALAKSVKAMKPAEAGALLSRLDQKLATRLLQHLGAKDTAAVLSTVKPDLAAELVSSLAVMPAPDKVRKRP